MATIAEYNLSVVQKASYRMTLALTDESGSLVDITNWSFTGSIKETVQSPTAITNFLCEPNVSQSSVELTLVPEQTTLLNRKKFFYDVIATAHDKTPIEVYRIIEGIVEVDLGVTDSV